jgi:hypothetical protein
MRILFLVFAILFISLLFPDVYSELMVQVDKDTILPFGDTATITATLDYVPKRNLVMVQIFDSTGSAFFAGREVQVDNNGVLKTDFQGYRIPVVGGVYKIVVTGINENDKIIENIGFFSIGLKKEQILVESLTSEKNGGGCLIATATYGTELAPQVQQLRELRDNSLLQTESGTQFMMIFNYVYYSFSPYIADYERENPFFREAVKIGITPLLYSLSLLNLDNEISEIELIFYGTGIISLNIVLYFIIPFISFLKLKNFIIPRIHSKNKHIS